MLKHITNAAYREFDDVIETLIKLCEIRQTIAAATRLYIHPASWAQEFCTVHVNIGRMSGKTTLISKLADRDSIVVTFNEHRAGEVKRKCGVGVRVYSPSGIMNPGVRELPAGMVFVDEPEAVFKTINRNDFYDVLTRNGPRTFVLLGQ